MSTPVKPRELMRAEEFLKRLGAGAPALSKYLNFITQTLPPSSMGRFPTRHAHHIVPRCMDENHEFETQLAYLGIADHFRAHHLLFYPCPPIPRRH